MQANILQELLAHLECGFLERQIERLVVRQIPVTHRFADVGTIERHFEVMRCWHLADFAPECVGTMIGSSKTKVFIESMRLHGALERQPINQRLDLRGKCEDPVRLYI